LVVHYDSGDQNLADRAHSACETYWNNTRSFHMNGRGWDDVGYSFFACPHDYILEGRGIDRYQAAQGTTAGNRDFYSVTLATGPGEEIPPAQINAVRRLRKWLIEDHSNNTRVLGHRDFVSTSCPGDRGYGLVEDGTFAQQPGAVLNATGDDVSILGLKHGDGKANGNGRRVRALQLMLLRINPAFLPVFGADEEYGNETADAVLAVRQSHGSSATNGNEITSYAYDQIWTSYIRAAAGPGGGDGDLPNLETVRVQGTLTLER
jgi:hypothetical protein